MTKSIKKIIITLLAAGMAFMLTAAFLLFSPHQTAFAEHSNTAWVVIDEIYDDSKSIFKAEELTKLYNALAGVDNLDALASKFSAENPLTSENFRTQNGGSNNVSVWFGGKKWDAVYLTTAQNGGGDTQKGDVILDLWQSTDTVTTRAGFAEWKTEALNTNTDIYPVNLYSASKMRVETLNAGGYYSTDANTLVSNKQAQNSGNQYARFTMSTVDNSLTEYIAKPSEVGYQATEFNSKTATSISDQSRQGPQGGSTYYLPNDAYDTPSGGQWFDSDFGNLYNKDDSRNDEAKYGAWQNDYLWLPSITEVGCSADATGMWNTDLSLRSAVAVNDEIGKTPVGSFVWLRSAFCSDEDYETYGPSFVYVMGVNEGSNNHADWTSDTTEMNLVRPALHLNLTAANGNVKSAWKNIGEIYQDGSNSFNADNMQALYTALTGAPSYGDVRTALSGGNKTSADFRTQNGGQNVTIMFGGIKWDAVYLTKAQNGDFILDLWQSVDSVTEKSKWADRTKAADNPNDAYPDNMYSTSYIRVFTLNAGGQYSTSGTSLSGVQVQDAKNKYARFTMSSVGNSLTKYLATPFEVGYQADEFDSTTANVYSGNHYTPNDAYSAPKGGEGWTDNKYNYGNKDKYGDWQNDYLWLPSITETGCGDTGTGIWKTDATLRNIGTTSIWTRSGDDDWAANAYALEPTGKNQHYYIDYEYTVRPAIHLNLTAINNSLKKVVEVPTINSKTYTGKNLTSGISDTTEYTVSEKGGVDVGFYEVEFTLKEPDNYMWRGKEPNEESITLKFEITTATNTWTAGGVTVDGGGWTYGDTGKLSAPSNFGSERVVFTYYNDSGGKADNNPLPEQPKNAGKYWVKATVPALKSTKDPSKNNYDEIVSVPVSFEIKKATLKVTSATVSSKTYDGLVDNPEILFTFDGFKKEEDKTSAAISVAGYEASYESANAADSVKVTVSLITLGGTAKDNYTVDLVNLPNITGKIEKAMANVTINTPQNAAYTGEEQPAIVSISVSGAPQLIESDYTVSYIGTVETNTTPKNADTYTVTVALQGNAAINYNLVDASATFTIEKAELTKPTPADAATVEGTYSGSPYEITVKDFNDKMTAKLSDNTKSSFEGGKFAATKAGKYTLTITISDQSNYMWTGGNSTDEVVFTIKIAKATVDLPQGEKLTEGQYKPEGYTVKISGYIGTLMKFVTTGVGVGFAADGTSDGTYNFTAENVGEYTLTISLNDTENYEWADEASDPTFTINISKKELEKPAGSASGAYNGKDYIVELANYDNATMQATEAPKGTTFEQKDGTWQFSAKDVGEYSITISLLYTDNYKWIGEGADPVITINIEEAVLSFTLIESSKTYTGLPHSDIDVVFTGDFGHLTKDSDYELSFEAQSDTTAQLDGNLPKTVGKYTVTLKLLGTTAQDYNLKVTTATYEIVNANLMFTLINASGGYTGNKHEDIDVNFTGIQNEEEFTKGTHYILSFAPQGDTTAQLDGKLPKTVGKYTVTVTLQGDRDTNYKVTTASQTYTINKAQITVSGEYSDSRAYNGEEYKQTITAAVEINGLTVEMPIADPSFEITIATEKWADTYTGEIEVKYDDVNFALTNSGTYTVTINKAKLTLSLTVTDGGKIYDGNNVAAVAGEIIAGIVNADEVTIAEIIANFVDATAGENKPITVTQVVLGGAMAGNYTVAIDALPALSGSIAKKIVEVVWAGYENLVYDGTSKAITATAKGVEGENIELIISYISNTLGVDLVENKPQNAGNYTASAMTENVNYALAEITATKTYTVAKQQVTAPTIASKVYNRAPQIADVEQSELYEVTENAGGTVVDNYNVKLTLTDSKNYTWTTSDEAEITLIFTITKATYDMSGVTFEDFSIIYDGEEHSILISGDLPSGVEVTYDGNGQKEVGKHTVTAYFTGDAQNFEEIPFKTAELTILEVSHDLDNIIFADVKVKYDGESHSIYIEGELPTNVTVAYEGNDKTEPNIYTVTAVFSDPDSEFARKTATLTILRTQTQTTLEEEGGESSGSGGSGDGESGTGGESVPEVFIDSEEGFDPTLELVVEKIEDISRTYFAWGMDEVSEKYSVSLRNQNGEEVPIEGKVTVRLLIPEAFRNKDFDLMALAKSGAASATSPYGIMPAFESFGATGPTSVEFTRDGDYVVFETDGLSDYVFKTTYVPYFPIIITATGVLLADVLALIVLVVIIRKKMSRKVR